jgi:hypothetical protein
MTKNEFEQLIAAPAQPVINGALLENQTPRTLVYGYTTDRNTFHVYLDVDGLLHRVGYDGDDFLLAHGDESKLIPLDFVPDKRVYPECCDLEFCRMLMRAGVSVPFTGYNENDMPTDDFIGNRLEDLIQAPGDHLAPIDVSSAELGVQLGSWLQGCAPMLETAVSNMLREMLDAPYRRAKYKTGYTENLELWLQNIPNNVEWKVRAWRERTLPNARELDEYTLPKELARALMEKVSKLVHQQLKEPTLTA